MSAPEKLTVTRDQRDKIQAYVRQEVEKAREQERRSLEKVIGDRSAEVQRSNRAAQFDRRRLGHHIDALFVANEASPEMPKLLKMLFRKLHRQFLTVDNYEEYMGEPKRNWPFIGAIVSLVLGGYFYFTYQTEFWKWAYTGVNGYALGIFALVVVGGFLYWRNREEKKTQSGAS